MSRTTTPLYRVEFTTSTGYQTPAAWNVRGYGQIPGYGKPTMQNLNTYMQKMVDSMEKPDGCNRHVIVALGKGAIPYYARLIRQADNKLMAVWADYSYRVEKCGTCEGGQTIYDGRNDSDRECPACKGEGVVMV